VTSTPAGLVTAETSLIAVILATDLRFPVKMAHLFRETRLTVDVMDLVLKRVLFEGGSVSGSDEETDGSKASMAEEQRRLAEKLNHWGLRDSGASWPGPFKLGHVGFVWSGFAPSHTMTLVVVDRN
jgi:hypothetical protein